MQQKGARPREPAARAFLKFQHFLGLHVGSMPLNEGLHGYRRQRALRMYDIYRDEEKIATVPLQDHIGTILKSFQILDLLRRS